MLGITVIFADHCRKPGPFEGGSMTPKKEQILGSQDKVAAVDFVLMMRSKKDLNGMEMNIYQVKNKAAREHAPFKVSMTEAQVEGEKRVILSYEGEIEERLLKVEEAKQLIKQHLNDIPDPCDARDIITALGKEVGKTNVEEALKEMRSGKEIGFKKEGQKFVYWHPLDKHDGKEVDKADQDDPMPNFPNRVLGRSVVAAF